MYRDVSDYATGEFVTSAAPIKSVSRRRPWLFPYQDDTKRVLVAAHSLVGQGWTKGQHATDRNDREINYKSDDAFNYCAHGAILRANLKLPAPILLGWYWRRWRYAHALQVMCLAIDAKNDTITDEDRCVMIEKWNDYAHHIERDIGFTVAIEIA